MIKNIVFDMGGVVFTIDHMHAVRCFQEIGLKDAEKRLDPYTQHGIFGDLESGKISDEEFRQKLSDIIGHEVSWKDCQYGLKGYLTDLPKRNLQTLRKLKAKGYHLILLSNTNPFMMGWAMSNEFDGEGNSLGSYFDATYLSYQCGMMKPDKSIFHFMLDKENIKAEETLYVDDGPGNVTAGASLGLHTFCPENGSDWTERIFTYLK